jgi:heme/copper-type cytochrome/quinol oxidase subunit 3
MALFVSSEAGFFLALILAYMYYRGGQAVGADAAALLDVPRTAVFTVLLLASSATIVLASARLRRDDRSGFQIWLLVTALLGCAFLAGQGAEYAGLLREHVSPSASLFGTTFFTLTGFHGLHVLVGLVAILILAGLAFVGPSPRSAAVETVAIYWHFVDAVWIVIFSVVYLWTLL